MGPKAVNLTYFEVKLNILWWHDIFKMRHKWLAFSVAFFWLNYYHSSHIFKQCYIFHEYTYLNHFNFLISISFSYKIINNMIELFNFYFLEQSILLSCMAWGHAISLVWGRIGKSYTVFIFHYFWQIYLSLTNDKCF